MVHTSAPFALLVAGSLNSTFDGRFLLRRGDPVVGDDACFIDDGVFWEHEFDESLIIEGVRGSAWYMRDTRRVEWSYRHDDVVTCDPSAGGPWSAHPNENPVAEGGPAAEDSSEPTVVSALADCWSRPVTFWELPPTTGYFSWQYEYKGTEFSLCNSVLLYTHKELVPKDDLYEWIPGFCEDVSNETSAAACLDRWCSQGADGVPQGDSACSTVGSETPDEDEGDSQPASEERSRTIFYEVVSILALVFLAAVFAHSCFTREGFRASPVRKDRIQPKEFLDESGMPRLATSPAAPPRPVHDGGLPPLRGALHVFR